MKQHSGQELPRASASDKVLITGIDGFTGKHIENKLKALGFDVYGTVIADSQNPKHFVCDIRNSANTDAIFRLIQPNYIVHLAAISFAGETNTSLIHDVNVIGTQNLLNSVCNAEINPLKIIIASSATVYGNQNASVLDESMTPKPVNEYGKSKLETEIIASTFFDKLNIVVVRPFNYTGPGQNEPFLIPKIVNHFRNKKKVIELGNIDVAREFNHVDDVCNVYAKLLSSVAKSTVVNVCSSHEVFLNDIITILNKMVRYEIEIKINPAFVRKNEISILKGSNKLLNTYITYSFEKGIEDTLREMYFFKS